MSTYLLANTRVPLGRKAGYGSDLTLAVYSSSTGVLNVSAGTDAGQVQIEAGTGGISIDATKGLAGASGSVDGGISLVSKANSSWVNTGADISIGTVTSGSVNVNSAEAMVLSANANSSFTTNGSNLTLSAVTGSVNVSSTGGGINVVSGAGLALSSTGATTIGLGSTSVSISTLGDLNANAVGAVNIGTSANSVTIGAPGKQATMAGDLNIAGDLNVSGTVTTVSRTNVDIGENLLVLNSAASGSAAGIDAGMLIQVAPVDIIANAGSPISTGTTPASSGIKTLALQLDDNTTVANTVVQVTSGIFSNQAAIVKSIANDIATLNNEWTPVPLPNTTITSVNISGGSLSITGTDLNTTYLAVGSLFRITKGVNKFDLTVASLTTNTSTNITLTFTGTAADDVYDLNVFMVSPDSGVTYSTYNNFFAGLFWHAATREFVFASTTSDPGYAAINPITNLIDIRAGKGSFTNLTFSGTEKASWVSGSDFGDIPLTLTGGIGTISNIVAHTDGSGSGINDHVLSLTQSSADGQGVGLAVAQIAQNFNQGNFFRFSGSSNTVGSMSALGYSLVSTQGGSNTNIIGQSTEGYLRVYVNDNDSGTAALTDGVYYIPIMKLDTI